MSQRGRRASARRFTAEFQMVLSDVGGGMSRDFANATSVAKALGGIRTGRGWLCRCPVIGHGRKRGDIHPSLSVADGDHRLLVHCHAGCDPRDVLAALRAFGLRDDNVPTFRPDQSPIERDHDSIRRAQALWESAKPAEGTPVEAYLRQRGIDIPIPAAIRFHESDTALTMVVAVHRSGSGLVAVQRTFLTRDGYKAPIARPRITTGELGDGAARLAATAAELGLAEGTEDALAAMQLKTMPCWASLGAARMHRVAIPDGVRELHIFADQDEPGLQAAFQAAEFHLNEGRRVSVRIPPEDHKDWGSVVEFINKNRRAA